MYNFGVHLWHIIQIYAWARGCLQVFPALGAAVRPKLKPLHLQRLSFIGIMAFCLISEAIRPCAEQTVLPVCTGAAGAGRAGAPEGVQREHAPPGLLPGR